MSDSGKASITCLASCPTTTYLVFISSITSKAYEINFFPETECKTFGKLDFILVPLPAANITPDTFISKLMAGGEGLEPSTMGPKPIVLPITPSPNCYANIF